MNRQAIAVKKYLDACEEIEEVASEIYHFNADLFAENEKISHMWRNTALEEENHALTVDMARTKIPGCCENHLNVSMTESTRNLLHALFEAITKSPPTEEEAIHIAIELEEMLARFHLENAACLENEAGADLFKTLIVNDLRHREVLENALREIMREKQGT